MPNRPAQYRPTGKAGVKRAESRPSARQRGYTHRWEQARKHYLNEHPLCVVCEREGKVTAATVVDHIVPHRGDEVKFWGSDNWQSMCKPHHDAKTGRGE